MNDGPSDFALLDSATSGLASDFGLPHTGIRQKREHEEERAEHVLALGNPGHGFDVQRMQRKQRGHQGAAPDAPVRRWSSEKQQRRVRRVQQQAGQVVPPGSGRKAAVQHVRQPRQRMPVAPQTGSEGPGDISPV